MHFDSLTKFPKRFHEKMQIAPPKRLHATTLMDSTLRGIVLELRESADRLQSILDQFEHGNIDNADEIHVVRMQLILEEACVELFTAMLNGDVVELMDALCDALYVIGGTAVAFGVDEALPECFTEVHRSNMSKDNVAGSQRVREKGQGFTKPDLVSILKRVGLML